ncbi:hypothetical protein B0H34DRAFT_666298 [Crassisporium funariophilum]|nr:hypothetical protein B0H34DRAFT_666298 [Crassisporium funariophilum]
MLSSTEAIALGPQKEDPPVRTRQKPNTSAFFTGRKDVLARLRDHFAPRINNERRYFLLHGMGGIGKTQICLKFSDEMSNSFTHVLWVDASTTDTIDLSLRGLSRKLTGTDRSAESVLHWLADLQEEWLLVFDNADGVPDVVQKFLPSGSRGNILITSRNRSLGRVTSFENSLELSQMEEEDAISLLLKASCLYMYISDMGYRDSARNIVNELCCLPLAVDQAGAAIESGLCTIHDYMQQLSQRRKQLMFNPLFQGASKYERTVYGTWELSYHEIESRAAGNSGSGDLQADKTALLILQTCAFFHYDNISEDIFQHAAEGAHARDINAELELGLPLAITMLDHRLLPVKDDYSWDKYFFREGIQVLLSFSLVKRSSSSDVFSIHPLVHCWSRDRMSQPDQQLHCRMANVILSSAIHWRFQTEDYAFRRLLLPHIKANFEYESQVGLKREYYDDEWTRFSLVIKEHGDWKESERYQLRILEERKRVLGENHPFTLTNMCNLASIIRGQGRWEEAEALDVEVLDKRMKILGEDHADTLTTMGNLALIYQNQGFWGKAEELELRVLSGRKRVLGEGHPSTLVSMGNLALIYHNQGRLNEAKDLGMAVLALKKECIGEDHPDTLMEAANLSLTWSNLGNWEKAEELALHALKARTRILGPEHPDTASSMANLAIIYRCQARWQEAQKLSSHSLELRKKVLGKDHLETLISMTQHATLLRYLGNKTEAEDLNHYVLETRKRLLGSESIHTLSSMTNLATTYESQGRFKEAQELEAQAYSLKEKVLGQEHQYTLISMCRLGTLHRTLGNLKDAEELGIQAMNIRKRVLGVEHPETLASVADVAMTYQQLKRWDDAEELQLQVLHARKRSIGEDSLLIVATMHQLAVTYMGQSREKEGVDMMLLAVAQARRLLAPGHLFLVFYEKTLANWMELVD